jgi:hypothetical protein
VKSYFVSHIIPYELWMKIYVYIYYYMQFVLYKKISIVFIVYSQSYMFKLLLNQLCFK